MRKLLLLAIGTLLLLPALAAAQSPFDGTWKLDLNKIDFPKKPDVFLLQNGMYSCKTCVPPFEVKADGQDHPVKGHPYYDSVAIKVISDHEIEETDKKNGKVVSTTKVTVSQDGKTAMFEFSDSSNSNAAPVTGKGEATRVAAGPAGSSPISGSWRTSKIEDMSSNGMSMTFKLSGDEFMMNMPTGQSYTAKLNGAAAAYKGDPGISTVSVKSMGKNTIEETDMRDGKVITVTKMTVSDDGKMLTFAWEDKLHGSNGKSVAMKQ